MQLSIIIAVIFSPVVAVLISIWVQHRKEKRQSQIWVLSTLIANRHQQLNVDNIRALNMIDFIFHKKAAVRKLWHEYYDMLCNAGLNNEIGWKQRSQKNIELITEMAKTLGYGKTISHLDIDRVYNPSGVVDQLLAGQELQKELLRVLKSTAKIEVQPISPENK